MKSEQESRNTIDVLLDPNITLKSGWSLYHWNGLSWKWVLCDPNGLKRAMTDRYGPIQVKSARRWAYRRIKQIRGT